MSTDRVKAFAGRCGWERFECRRRSRRKIGLAERENIRYAVAEMRRAILLHRDVLRLGKEISELAEPHSNYALCLFLRTEQSQTERNHKHERKENCIQRRRKCVGNSP